MHRMRDSRRKVIDLLRIHGSLTADEIAGHMHARRNAAVHHLSALEREGLVARVGLRAGARRPSVTYALTETANGLFPQGYDTFAISLLDELKSVDEGLAETVIRKTGRRWIARDLPLLKAAAGQERFKRAIAVMVKHGFMPKLQRTNGTYTLLQYNCPVRRVGSEYPEVCANVTRWVQALLGVRVRQTQCASHGAAFCAYTVQTRGMKPGRPAAER